MNKIRVSVLRFEDWDCTNGGITSKVESLTLGTEESESDLIIYKRTFCDGEYVCCYPRTLQKGEGMAGGNFVYTNDSRYVKLTGVHYPISVHDRTE